ncbi:MAG: TIGR00730 family Rossman fold protein [Candidatus Cryptobacteroides sp.]|nr:TIGR00730 family Rossman fold protein [Bacteroidales bacterium]
MSGEKKLAIFCSASYDIDPEYNTAAAEFTRRACAKGYVIVSGGTVKGTMGVVADAVRDCGGTHIGILPRFMEEFTYPALSSLVWTDTMSERKERMREGTSAVVALPGGIGTLDELVETLTLAKLGKYDGRIFALNIGGFYDKFIELLDYYVSTGMLDQNSRNLISFPTTVGELDELI